MKNINLKTVFFKKQKKKKVQQISTLLNNSVTYSNINTAPIPYRGGGKGRIP